MKQNKNQFDHKRQMKTWYDMIWYDHLCASETTIQIAIFDGSIRSEWIFIKCLNHQFSQQALIGYPSAGPFIIYWIHI